MGAFTDLEDHFTTEAHERRIKRCMACNARIVWLKTDRGKNIPVDADSVKPQDQVYVWGSDHVVHFKTCPNASQFRRTT